MKKLIFFFLALLIFFTACEKTDNNDAQNSGQISLTVTTYNVLKPDASARDEDNMSMTNPDVRRALASSIMTTESDIIGFGELDESHLSGKTYDLARLCNSSSSFREYTWSLDWPNHISSNYTLSLDYADGFAYKHTKLELLDQGFVWLSKTDNTWYEDKTQAYGNAGSPARICIWTKFMHKESEKIFWVFVTHLPTGSQGGQENMARVVNKFAKEKAGDDPAILIGDMNANPSSETYRILTGYWRDGNNTQWGTMSGASSTEWHDPTTYSNTTPGRRIDHVMTKGCAASRYRRTIVTYTSGGKAWCPSDHLPVTATVTIK